MLRQLQQQLLTLHPGHFQDDAYLRSWFTPAISARLLERGVVLRPARVVYGVGVPMRCHENALTYATLHETATAYFGLGLYQGCWWVHSFCVEADGSVIDSSEPTTPALYFGVEWREVYPLIPKKSGAMCAVDLPPILQGTKKIPEKSVWAYRPTIKRQNPPSTPAIFTRGGARSLAQYG